MPRPSRFSPEVRTRAVRMVVEHEAAHDSQWAAITSIAEKIGCTAETLRKWVRQAEVEDSELVAKVCPLLSEAVRLVAHRVIRNRGTVGGSLAHADPTAELATAALALDADLRLASPRGPRDVPVHTFFDSPFVTVLEPDEMLVEVRLPPRPSGEGWAFEEVAVREGDFAIVAVAALATLGGGVFRSVRIAWSGIGAIPASASRLAEALQGLEPGDPRVEASIADAASRLEPPGDVRGSPDYRRHLARVLTLRAVQMAAARSAGGARS